MIPTFDFSNLDIEESPASIAYALVVWLVALYDMQLNMEDDGFSSAYIEACDSDGDVHFRVRVSSVMASLLLAVLDDMDNLMRGAVERSAWQHSMN